MAIRFRPREQEEPEINLIPFIDILLVVLIFLMLTTTFSRYSQLQLMLPVAEAEAAKAQAHEIVVAVAADGRYAVAGQVLIGAPALEAALQQAAAAQPEAVLIINADASATHQAVINVLEAARLAGLQRITFATQQPSGR